MERQARKDYNLLLSESGIELNTSFEEAISTAMLEEKLLLIYFPDSDNTEDNFLNILINTDVNSLFKRGFTIYISSIEQLHQEFFNMVGGEPADVVNKIYLIGMVRDEINHVCTISANEMKETDILYELYTVHTSYEEKIMENCDKDAAECSESFMKRYQLITRRLHYQNISVKEALTSSMDQPVPYLKKILMLYMYKDGSTLSTQLNLFLMSAEMKKYIKLLTTIFWDISNSNHHKALKMLCQTYFDQDVLEETVSSDEGGLFFFLPDEGVRKEDIKQTPRIFTSYTSSCAFDTDNFRETLEYIFSYFESTHEITIMNEMEAIDAYRSNSLSTFEDLIERSSLNDVEAKCLQIPRKMLLLYFHTPMSKLQDTLPSIKNIMIVNQVCLVPWTVNNKFRNEVLSMALQRTFGLKKITSILEAQKSALFIFVPIGNTLVLHSMVGEDATASSITKAYKAAHKFFILESRLSNNDNDDSGPAAYQQILCNQLKDRDFDCFQLAKKEGEELKKKIAFAYFGPPTDEDDGYSSVQQKQIANAYTKISSEAAKYGEDENMLYISFMRVCITPLPDEKHSKVTKDITYDPSLDFSMLPLFCIRKCFDCPKNNTACRIYIDHIGRIYQGWDDFIENNKYPKVMLIAPKNGRYSTDYRGKVQLEVCPSPACGIGVAILKGVDIGMSVAGGIAGIVGIVATSFVAVPVLPFIAMGTGLGVGIYSVARSGMTIAERVKYGESMSFREAEARGAYLNIIAGSLGFTSAGATFAISYMARSGVNIGNTARLVVNGITIANVTAGGTAMGNSAYDIIVQWTEDGRPNTLALLQFASSVLFFGHAVYNTQFAGTIIENSQTSTIQKILDTLSSNRQRKTVMNLLSATTDQVGSSTTARAEVIRYIRNLDNVQEVVGVLTRDTKMLSRNGVKYSVKNGQILFNGVEMNVNEFGNMAKVQRHEMVAAISSETVAPHRGGSPVKSKANTTINRMETIFSAIQTISPIVSLAFEGGFSGIDCVKILMARFTPFIQELVLATVGTFLAHIGVNAIDLHRSISDLFPATQVPLIILQKVLQVYWMEDVHNKIPNGWRNTIDHIIRLMERAIMISMMTPQQLMVRLTVHCCKWVIQVMIDRRIEPEENGKTRPRSTKSCNKCNGKFYQA